MAGQNPLDRRAQRLSMKMERRTQALIRRLTEPAPPFKVRLSEEDQVRKYLDLKESGGLAALRESNGGPQTDADVDRYVAHMEHLMAKLAPHMLLRQYQEPAEFNQNPFNFHEGLVAALGLDGDTPSVDRARAEAEPSDDNAMLD